MKYIKKNNVYEYATTNWYKEDDFVIVYDLNQSHILNQTVSAVWSYIDGVNSLEDIYEIIRDKYFSENINSGMDVEKIVDDSIELLLEKNLIVSYDPDNFEGWF